MPAVAARARSRTCPSSQAAAGSLHRPAEQLQRRQAARQATARSSAAQGETLGVGIDDSGRQFSPLKLKQGEWAARRRRDRPRRRHGVQAATSRSATRSAPPAPARPSPTRSPASPRYGSVDSLGGASLAIFDLPTAQALFEKEGAYDSISVKAKEGVTPAALTKEIKPLLPKTADVKTGDAQAAADSKDTNESLKFITYFLLGFAGIALFVGAFVILNTLSITVAQRSREFATLRTLGASRRQVMRSVVLEGLVVGLLASVLGLLLGLGIAKGMSALFAAMGVDLPEVRHGARERARSSSACSRARSSRSWPASSRRCAPPACRRSRPSARARRPRRPAAAAASRTRAVAVVGVALALIALGLFGGVR